MKTIIHNQTVRDRQSVRLHRMSRPIVKVAYVRIVEVRDLPGHGECGFLVAVHTCFQPKDEQQHEDGNQQRFGS